MNFSSGHVAGAGTRKNNRTAQSARARPQSKPKKKRFRRKTKERKKKGANQQQQQSNEEEIGTRPPETDDVVSDDGGDNNDNDNPSLTALMEAMRQAEDDREDVVMGHAMLGRNNLLDRVLKELDVCEEHVYVTSAELALAAVNMTRAMAAARKNDEEEIFHGKLRLVPLACLLQVVDRRVSPRGRGKLRRFLDRKRGENMAEIAALESAILVLLEFRVETTTPASYAKALIEEIVDAGQFPADRATTQMRQMVEYLGWVTVRRGWLFYHTPSVSAWNCLRHAGWLERREQNTGSAEC